MRKILLLAAVGLSAGAAFAQWVAPAEVPAGVYEVDPQQGRVVTSNNDNPLGVKQVAVNFNNTDITINEGAGEFKLYKEGVSSPVATLPVGLCHIDTYMPTQVGWDFPGNWIDDGVYRVEIPAGAWTVAGKEIGGFSLNYEIFHEMLISPEVSVVESLETFQIVFPGASSVTYTPQKEEVGVFKTGSAATLAADVTIEGNVATVTLKSKVTEMGTYMLQLPAKSFAMTYDKRPSDGAPFDFSMTSAEEIIRYYVTSLEAPEIIPAPGDVKEFLKFTVGSITDPNFQFFFFDTMGRGFIYPVSADGTVGSSPVCSLRVVNNDGVAELWVLDDEGYMLESPVNPGEGRYMLTLPEGLIVGSYNDAMVMSAPYQYLYTIGQGSGVTLPSAESWLPLSGGIYTVDGVMVSREATPSSVQALPKGLYIIGGKKIVK